MQLLQKNAAIMRSVVADMLEQNSPAVLLVVSNPVDVMTHVVLRSSGWDKGRVIDYKGATWFAVGLALVRITRAILRSEKSVLTVSTMLEGEFGLQDVCLSVPCIVSGNGVEKIIESPFPEPERTALTASANVLKTTIAQLDSAD